MNKKSFLYMSREIPVYPSQPILSIGSVESDGPPQYNLDGGEERVILSLNEDEVSSLGWSDPSDAALFINTCYEEETIEHGYQYYYWYIDVEVTEKIETGLICNTMWHNPGNGNNTTELELNTINGGYNVRIWFIFHPTDLPTASQWYIGLSKDSTSPQMFAALRNTSHLDLYIMSDLVQESPNTFPSKMFLVPWTDSSNNTFVPRSLTLIASNKLPLQ